MRNFVGDPTESEEEVEEIEPEQESVDLEAVDLEVTQVINLDSKIELRQSSTSELQTESIYNFSSVNEEPNITDLQTKLQSTYNQDG